MKKKILIIDDEFELCMLLKLHFVARDYDVEMAYNIKDGMAKLNQYNPDLIFLDNNLPDGFGWDTVPFIKTTHPQTKINLMTGDSTTFENYQVNGDVVVMGKPLSRTQIDKCLSF
jgi:DNA-binding response OmpR family regulator